MDKGVLYLVPTPVGNMKDMTFRAVEVLSQVDFIYAEDTRTSRFLLQHYDIDTPLLSYHKFNERKRCEEITEKLENGQSIAIISDAGSPGISDPSNIIVAEAVSKQLTVCPLPGATALIPAVTGSAFNTERFVMIGFLPGKKSERQNLLEQMKNIHWPVVIYESPHHLHETLAELYQTLGERDICIAREISKMFESWYRNTLSHFVNHPQEVTLKGEFVLILDSQKHSHEFDPEMILTRAVELLSSMPVSEIARTIAKETGFHKNKIYNFLIEQKLK